MSDALKEIATKNYESTISNKINALKTAYDTCEVLEAKNNIATSIASLTFSDEKEKNITSPEAIDDNWFRAQSSRINSIINKRQTEMLEASNLMKIQLRLQNTQNLSEEDKKTLANLSNVDKKMNPLKKFNFFLTPKKEYTWFKSKKNPMESIKNYINSNTTTQNNPLSPHDTPKSTQNNNNKNKRSI